MAPSEPQDWRSPTRAHGRLTISVAMATHNGQRFLGEQLRSLAVQSQPPLELVVVDDASTDGTLSVLKRFAAEAPFRVQIGQNNEALGHGETFFRAMQLCQGDLIAFCDQDDVWQKEKLARCTAAFETRRDLSLVVHAGRVVDERLTPSRTRVPRIRSSQIVDLSGTHPWFVHHGFAIVMPRWLRDLGDPGHRPDALARVGRRPMDHDEWACFLAPAAGPIALLADELVLYRRHRRNASVLDAPGFPVPGPFRRVPGGNAAVTVLRPALGGARGMAGLFDITAKVGGYLTLADNSRTAASYLREIADRQCDKSERRAGRMSKRASMYESIARRLLLRANAVSLEGSRMTRLRAVTRLAFNGNYGSTIRGGLGLPSLALDALIAVSCPGGSLAP